MSVNEWWENGVLIRRADDDARTVTTWPGGTTRPYTPEENAAADARISQAVMLTDLYARLERIEAHLWPAPPDPATVDDAPEWSGIWPAGGLLRDGGRVWRNVTTVPITSRPSEFPGTPEQWTHLFVEVIIGTVDPDPEPEPDPDTGVLPWTDKGSPSYKTGDLRTWPEGSSTVYRCRQDHTAHEGAGYNPSVASLWEIAP